MKNKREGTCTICGLWVKSFMGLLIKVPIPNGGYNYKVELMHRHCYESTKPKRYY